MIDARLGHAGVGSPLLPQLVRDEFPHVDLAGERARESMKREDANREVRASAYQTLRAFRRKEILAVIIVKLRPLQSKDPARAERYLEWASQKRLGPDPAAWSRWWEAARDEFQFPGSPGPPSPGKTP